MTHGPEAPQGIDTSVAHPARMYDYYLGGTDNFEADRQVADQLLAVLPEARDMAVANRAFLRRVVAFLAGEAGVTQFLDIGSGLPTRDTVHQVAQRMNAEARVVYVDNDPIVLAHGRALLSDTDQTTVILSDLREPGKILENPELHRLLDFDRPVAILVTAIFHFIRDVEGPERIVATLEESLPPGGYLAISHATGDFSPELAHRAAAFYEKASAPMVLRSKDEVAALFAGLELVEPGLVQVPLWRPAGALPGNLDMIWLYGGVGVKR